MKMAECRPRRLCCRYFHITGMSWRTQRILKIHIGLSTTWAEIDSAPTLLILVLHRDFLIKNVGLADECPSVTKNLETNGSINDIQHLSILESI